MPADATVAAGIVAVVYTALVALVDAALVAIVPAALVAALVVSLAVPTVVPKVLGMPSLASAWPPLPHAAIVGVARVVVLGIVPGLVFPK